MKKIIQNKTKTHDTELNPMKNDSKNILNDILEVGGTLDRPLAATVMRPDRTISNISVSVFINGNTNKLYEYILDNIETVYQGQCICLTDDNSKHNVYIIKYLNLNCYSINDLKLEYIGELMLYRGVLYNRQTISIGDCASYNGKDYLFTTKGWKLMDLNDISNINLDNITTPNDIIDTFDKLQKRATELGYPIKLFDKVSPIHPTHRPIDVELSLVYDENTPNAILAAINIKQPFEKFWRDMCNAKS